MNIQELLTYSARTNKALEFRVLPVLSTKYKQMHHTEVIFQWRSYRFHSYPVLITSTQLLLFPVVRNIHVYIFIHNKKFRVILTQQFTLYCKQRLKLQSTIQLFVYFKFPQDVHVDAIRHGSELLQIKIKHFSVNFFFKSKLKQFHQYMYT